MFLNIPGLHKTIANSDKTYLELFGFVHLQGVVIGKTPIICPAALVNNDGTQTGHVLVSVWRTRCVKPRYDGIIYSLEDKKCFKVNAIRDWMKRKRVDLSILFDWETVEM